MHPNKPSTMCTPKNYFSMCLDPDGLLFDFVSSKEFQLLLNIKIHKCYWLTYLVYIMRHQEFWPLSTCENIEFQIIIEIVGFHSKCLFDIYFSHEHNLSCNGQKLRIMIIKFELLLHKDNHDNHDCLGEMGKLEGHCGSLACLLSFFYLWPQIQRACHRK